MLKYILPLLFKVRPAMVHGMIRERMAGMIPLNALLGIEITTVGEGVAEATLPYRPDISNHIGSVHATAIFGLAEAASGAAMSGALAPVMLKVRPVAASGAVKFFKIAKTGLTAYAEASQPAKQLRATLAKEGKVVFDVVVAVRDAEGADIAQVTVAWHVSNK